MAVYIAEMALFGAAIGTALAWIAIAATAGPPRQRVPLVERKIAVQRSELRSEIAAVRSEITELRNEMRAGFAELRAQIEETNRRIEATNRRIEETNRILVGLANHRHDTDGTTVFTIPQP
ncbi:MAG: hypothetical protein F4W95_09465 [Chloroflexi bacterium]|nr:hypothetical protein [Chloroflexota bacterium]MYD48697.1 hypothetical protein [Chloroflexota bacterium]